MAGQGIDRRQILRYISIASVASTFPGFRQWTFACSHDDHAAHATAQTSSQPYKPLFLSPEQFRLVEHLTEMIIPAIPGWFGWQVAVPKALMSVGLLKAVVFSE